MALFGKKNKSNQTQPRPVNPVDKIDLSEETLSPSPDVKPTASHRPSRLDNVKVQETDVSKVAQQKKVDFSRLNRDQLVNMCCELIIEVKKLNNIITKHEEDNNSVYDDLAKQKREVDKTVGKVRNLALKLSSSYVRANVNAVASSLNVDQIIDMISKDILNERKEHQERVIELETDNLRTHQLFDQVREQFKKTVQFENDHPEIPTKSVDNDRTPVMTNDEDVLVSDDEQSTVTTVPTDNDEEDGIPDAVFEEQAETLIGKDNSVGINYVDFDSVKSRLGPLECEIIRLIGAEGLSLYSDIEERLNNIGGTKSKNESAYNNLKGLGVIECLDGDNLLKTMKRSGGVRVLWLSKSVGNVVYQDLFKKKPVVSEQATLIAENDNLVHGYSIKECAEVLNDLGFQNISYKRKENTIDLGSGKKWIPDIIAVDPVSGNRVFFEVEYGNHSNEDFSEKLTKANMKASVLRIITANSNIKAKMVKQVEYWLSKRGDRSTSMEISICTYNEMCKKTWGKEYR